MKERLHRLSELDQENSYKNGVLRALRKIEDLERHQISQEVIEEQTRNQSKEDGLSERLTYRPSGTTSHKPHFHERNVEPKRIPFNPLNIENIPQRNLPSQSNSSNITSRLQEVSSANTKKIYQHFDIVSHTTTKTAVDPRLNPVNSTRQLSDKLILTHMATSGIWRPW